MFSHLSLVSAIALVASFSGGAPTYSAVVRPFGRTSQGQQSRPAQHGPVDRAS